MKQFNEQDHPRASDGKFTSKGGESSNPKDLQKDIDVEEVKVKESNKQETTDKVYEMLKGGAKEEDVVKFLEEQNPEADFYELKDYVSQLAGSLEDNEIDNPRGLQKDVDEPVGKNEVEANSTPKLDKKTQKVYDSYKDEIDKKTKELNTHYSDEAIEKNVKTFGRGDEYEERKLRIQFQREKENIENGIKRYQRAMEKLVSNNK
jgi:hypothetical protein